VHPSFNYPLGGRLAKLVDLAEVKKQALPPVIRDKVGAVDAGALWDSSTDAGQWHDAIFKTAPVWLQHAVGQQPEIRVLREGDGAYFLPNLNNPAINMGQSAQYDNVRNASTWAHEFGHFMDFQIGIDSPDIGLFRSAADDFSGAMRKDARGLTRLQGYSKKGLADKAVLENEYEQVLAGVEQLNMTDLWADIGLNYKDVRAALKKHTIIDKYDDKLSLNRRVAQLFVAVKYQDAQGFLNLLEGQERSRRLDFAKIRESYSQGLLGHLSDLFAAATNKKVEGCGSHSAAYFRRKGNRQTECWANFTALYSDGNPFWAFVAKQFAPQMADIYKDATRGMSDE
jgi:hypothetical protein